MPLHIQHVVMTAFSTLQCNAHMHNIIQDLLSLSPIVIFWQYRSILGERPLPGKHPFTTFQGATVVASMEF